MKYCHGLNGGTLGKGFAEIISFELGKTRAVRIVDREKRNEALQEMEFALSGATDEANQIHITDLGDALLFKSVNHPR